MTTYRITVVTLPHMPAAHRRSMQVRQEKTVTMRHFQTDGGLPQNRPGNPVPAQKFLLSLLPGRPGLHPARHEAGDPCRPGQIRPAWQGGGAPQGTPPLIFS